MGISQLDAVLDQWEDLHPKGSPRGAYYRLRSVMSELVPQPDAIATAVINEDERALLVLQANNLFIGKATSGEQDRVATEVRREPLDATRINSPHGRAGRGRGR